MNEIYPLEIFGHILGSLCLWALSSQYRPSMAFLSIGLCTTSNTSMSIMFLPCQNSRLSKARFQCFSQIALTHHRLGNNVCITAIPSHTFSESRLEFRLFHLISGAHAFLLRVRILPRCAAPRFLKYGVCSFTPWLGAVTKLLAGATISATRVTHVFRTVTVFVVSRT